MKTHPIYTNYKANILGEVFGPRTKLNPTKHHTGYSVISVTGRRQYRVHRFVWECFNELLKDDQQINHKDGCKYNNNLSNLEVVTASENTKHAFRIGLKKPACGETNHYAKLSNKEALSLLKDLVKGYTNDELGVKYKLHPRYVSLIRHKRRWKWLWKVFEGSETISKESTLK